MFTRVTYLSSNIPVKYDLLIRAIPNLSFDGIFTMGAPAVVYAVTDWSLHQKCDWKSEELDPALGRMFTQSDTADQMSPEL